MNAALAVAWEVEDMSVEERLVQIESDMGHVLSTLVELKGDAKSTKGEIKDVRGEIKEVRGDVQEVRCEVQEVRGEVQKVREELKGDLHSFKTETAKEFGFVRADIEKVRTAIESVKVWFLVTCFGAVFSGIGAVVGLHALKLF